MNAIQKQMTFCTAAAHDSAIQPSASARDLYRTAYRDARILKYQFPPMYPVSVSAIPLRIKLAARQTIETFDQRPAKGGYYWTNKTLQHHYELLTSDGLQY